MDNKELVNKVKTRIDEVSASGDTLVDVGVENTKPYDSIIEELLDESAMEVLLKAPFYRLSVTDGSKATDVKASKDLSDDYVGTLTLPTDFIRLVSLRMKSWKQPVTTFALPGDAVAVKQSNKYIRGGIAKPVAVLYRNSTSPYAHYYSVASANDHSVTELLYIKKQTATELATASAEIVDALCWICAGKTLGVLGEKGLAELCYENAKGLMV
jgi:hypothetical protein